MADIEHDVWVGEAGWELIDGGHELSGPSPKVAGTLAATAPLALPTEYLTWESFEHVVAAITREVEGAYEAPSTDGADRNSTESTSSASSTVRGPGSTRPSILNQTDFVHEERSKQATLAAARQT